MVDIRSDPVRRGAIIGVFVPELALDDLGYNPNRHTVHDLLGLVVDYLRGDTIKRLEQAASAADDDEWPESCGYEDGDAG